MSMKTLSSSRSSGRADRSAISTIVIVVLNSVFLLSLQQLLQFSSPANVNSSSSNSSNNNNLPILQINDFNQGRFLTRSLKTNETCPFRSCTKNQRGNRYHTPERFMECVDQSDAIDTYSLGSTFFFLLTDGFDPHYDERNYMKAIKSGKEVHVPRRMDYLDHHEAYVALKEVMTKCLAFELRDRPSALEVVRMLEDKLKEIEA
mmetsp:Transcript_22276/g.42055  ORF Transcript_22276/g.42055 Transcript_22276/m.42055 type:complete len:204 (+) Transcript_22276:117-728(+)